jgi:hypothetical protein
VLLALGHYRQREYQVSSDGDRYLTMGRKQAVPYPFQLRWLVPLMCSDSLTRWRISTDLHLVALPVVTSVYIGHWVRDPAAVIVGGLLVCGFPGIWHNNIRRPVLVDPPALTWAVAAAVLSQQGWAVAAVAVAMVGACMKETAPVFAAAFALDPLLVIGLLTPAVRAILTRPGPDTHNSKALADPLGSARAAHADRLFDPVVMLAPWGAGLLAVFTTQGHIVAVLVLSLVLGYAQLATAVNTVRLYQWAGPAVALAATSVIPPGWAPAVLLVHLFNPLAGNGR